MAQTFTRVSQQAARYTLMGGVERCGRCRFFLKNNLCARVMGDVSPSAWCKFFSMAATMRADAGGGAAATHAGSGGPPGQTLSLDFTTGTLDPRITFTRASIGTYFDVAGTLQTATANTPRFDYDPVTHAARGLLIEESRINILTNSQAINSWALKTDVTIADNNAVSPDGTTNASFVTEGSAGTATIGSNNPAVAASATVTYSIFLKRGNTDWVRMLGTDNGSANGLNAWINLTTGASSFTVRGTATAISISVQALINGWYRLVGTATLIGTSTIAALSVISASGNGSATRVNNATYYAWGAQMEVGAFPTSYIPTTAAAVTRSADVASIPTAGWFSATAASFMTEYMVAQSPNPSATNRVTAGPNDGTVNNRLVMQGQVGSSTGVAITGIVAGASYAAPVAPVGAVAANVATKLAGAWTGTTAAGVLNGGAVASVAGGIPAGITTLTIGNSYPGAALYINGWMRRIQSWPRALTNSEMQQVTT